MRKRLLLSFFVLAALVNFTIQASAEIDMSVFENNPDLYEVEIDEFDDTGEIKPDMELLDNVAVFDLDSDHYKDALAVQFDIKLVDESGLAVPRIILVYLGEDWIFIDKVILKTDSNRYTFEVESETEVNDDGKVFEYVTIPLGDISIQLLEDIRDQYYRLQGDTVEEEKYLISIEGRVAGSSGQGDFSLTFKQADKIAQMYDDFVVAGGLEQDLALVDRVVPCEIKELD